MNLFNILNKGIRIFANERFLVVAGNIVPFDSIIVNIVQSTKTRFRCFVDAEFSIVRLRFLEVSSLAPWLVTPVRRSGIGGSNLCVRV